MKKTTSTQSLLYTQSHNNSTLLKVIDYAINGFCTSLGFKKNYFNVFLPYSEKQYPKYINPCDDSHNLKITDLQIILEKLDTPNKKIILDSLCQTHGFLCVDSAETENNDNSLERILLNITSTDGALSKTFLEATQDNEIDDFERTELKAISYSLRSLLRVFENRINL